jgi:iron complex outermembrane receptor protein
VFDIARDLQLGLTLASSGRAPAQTELYARGPHEGTNTFERGDAELGIERANAIEATLHWRREGAHLEAALWAARHEDFIHGSFTGRSCDEEGECAPGGDGELRELVYRAADARFHGVELEWEQRLGAVAGGELSARLTGDAVRARFVRGGDVPRIPAWRTGVGLEWNTARWRVATDLRRTGRQSAPGEFDTQTPAYTSVDASVSWQAPALAGLQLTLVGRNLTDSEQRNAASFNKDTLLLPGRDLRLLARLQF